MIILSFGDNVRVKNAPETEAIGVAGALGSVSGFTTPSVTNVRVVGEVHDDYALAVTFEPTGDTYWFIPELLEFVDHAPDTEIWVAGAPFKSVRTANGEWFDIPLAETEADLASHRQGRRTRIRTTLLAVALVAIIPWLVPLSVWLREAIAVDRCLDSGGSFDYSSMRCDADHNHPYITFRQRHPRLVAAISWLSASTTLAIVIGIVLLLRPIRGPHP